MMVKKETKKSNEALIAAAGTIAIVFGSLLALLVVDLLFPFRREEFPDMAAVFTIGSTLSIAMFLLSTYLTFVYLKDYLELKSKFTLGLLLMMVAFMLFSLTSMPLMHNLFGVFGRPSLFSIVPYLLATVSLAILAWLSSK